MLERTSAQGPQGLRRRILLVGGSCTLVAAGLSAWLPLPHFLGVAFLLFPVVLPLGVRWALRPAQRQADAFDAVAAGNTDMPVDTDGRDALGRMGAAVTTLSRDLAASRSELETRSRVLADSTAENTRLFATATRSNARLAFLQDTARAAATSDSVGELMDRVHEGLRHLVPYGYLTLLRHQPDQGSFRREFLWLDDPAHDPPQPTLPVGSPGLAQVLQSRQPWIVEVLSDEPVFAGSWLPEAGFRSALLVPLVFRNEVVGVLGLAAVSERAFSGAHRTTVLSAAGPLALRLRSEITSPTGANPPGETVAGLRSRSLAHEINNLLQAITGRAQLMRIRAAKGSLRLEELDAPLAALEQSAMDAAEALRRGRAPRPGPHAESAPGGSSPHQPPLRILVADDEPGVLDTLVALLEAMGHSVTGTRGGQELLDRFEPGAFDLVMTDLGMPEVSGWDVAARIREQDDRIPVVLVTAWGNEIRTRTARERGVTTVVSKPFTVQQVATLLSELRRPPHAA